MMSSAGLPPLQEGVSEAAGADVVLDVENHVVVMIGRWSHGNGVELKLVAHFPRHDVVRAGGVATKA
jgi:hypothetical protein